jgi:hypothetical protein
VAGNHKLDGNKKKKKKKKKKKGEKKKEEEKKFQLSSNSLSHKIVM